MYYLHLVHKMLRLKPQITLIFRTLNVRKLRPTAIFSMRILTPYIRIQNPYFYDMKHCKNKGFRFWFEQG